MNHRLVYRFCLSFFFTWRFRRFLDHLGHFYLEIFDVSQKSLLKLSISLASFLGDKLYQET